MSRTLRSTTVTVAVALSLSLSACTGGGDGGPLDTGPSPDDASGGPQESGPGAIDQFYNDLYGDTSNDLRYEEALARCMTEKGFQYLPLPVVEQESARVFQNPVGTPEYAKEYGYGITTDPWGYKENPPADPNAAYVASLSETDKTAYTLAFTGDTERPAGADGKYDWEQGGCVGAATHDIFGSVRGLSEAAGAQLLDDITALRTSIPDDPRVTELISAWSACMADAGYPDLTALGDAPGSVQGMVDQAYAAVSAGTATQSAAAQIDHITPVEIATAVADAECRDTSGYTGMLKDVTDELQQEFYDDHRDQFDKWREATLAVGN